MRVWLTRKVRWKVYKYRMLHWFILYTGQLLHCISARMSDIISSFVFSSIKGFFWGVFLIQIKGLSWEGVECCIDVVKPLKGNLWCAVLGYVNKIDLTSVEVALPVLTQPSTVFACRCMCLTGCEKYVLYIFLRCQLKEHHLIFSLWYCLVLPCTDNPYLNV